MRLFGSKDQQSAAATEGWKERIKGVVEGTAFRFQPLAPQLDRLETPVRLTQLPRAPFPEQTLHSRLRRFIAGKRAERYSPEQRLHWRFYDTVEEVLALVRPDTDPAATTRRRHEATPSPGITHPYQIKTACELMADLPEGFAAERRYLDELLSSILVAYRTEISRRTVGSLSFFREAEDYFISGYRIEKTALRSAEHEAKIAACQQIYDSYHHGINYYIFALITREPFGTPNTVFQLFCNALYFRARLEWNGTLLERPIMRKLPARNWVLYFALRDRSLLRQYLEDPAHARQVKDLLNAFPADDDGKVRRGRRPQPPAARSTRFDAEANAVRRARPEKEPA